MDYFEIQQGATSQMVEFDVQDSSSAAYARLAGLLFNSASLVAYYNRQNAAGAATAIALVTMTKGTWVSGGFVAIDAVNMPGRYQLCLPNAVVAAAAGVNFVTVTIHGAANMVPVTLDIRLTNWVASTTPANTLDVSATVTNLLLALKLLRNKVVTNPATGVMTVYDDDNATVLYTANAYEDVAGTMPFDGTGANRRDRLA